MRFINSKAATVLAAIGLTAVISPSDAQATFIGQAAIATPLEIKEYSFFATSDTSFITTANLPDAKLEVETTTINNIDIIRADIANNIDLKAETAKHQDNKNIQTFSGNELLPFSGQIKSFDLFLYDSVRTFVRNSNMDIHAIQEAVGSSPADRSSNAVYQYDYAAPISLTHTRDVNSAALGEPLGTTLPGRIILWVMGSLNKGGYYKLPAGMLIVFFSLKVIIRMFTKEA